MGSNIPHARELLKSALSMEMSREARSIVSEALQHMTRHRIKITARNEANTVTRQIAEDVLRYYHRNPEMSCRAIGEMFNINGGRVSEIITRGAVGLEEYAE